MEPRSGLVQRRAALRDGVHPDQLRAELRRGDLVPLQRGVYLPAGRPPGPLDRARAALLAVPEVGAVASHLTAARIHGLVVPDSAAEHVTIPRPLRRPNRDRLRLHTARLADEDRVEVDGTPVTSIARTLVDLGRELATVDAVWSVERALAAGVVDPMSLEAAAQRLRRAPGIARARRLLRAARPASGSPLETEARLTLVAAGLPEPELQVEVDLGSGGRAFLDLGYREQRIGIELDGRDHERVDALFQDRWRQNAVHSERWVLYRFTWRDIRYTANRFVDAVARAFVDRGGQPIRDLSLERVTTGCNGRSNKTRQVG